MLSWEFTHLPIFHNAPVDGWDEDRLSYVDGMQDDTPLNISLESGNLQQPCQRYALDAVCCVYTCRRLIDLSLIAGTYSAGTAVATRTFTNTCTSTTSG